MSSKTFYNCGAGIKAQLQIAEAVKRNRTLNIYSDRGIVSLL